MGSLVDGFDWVSGAAGETGKGLSQIWDGVSKKTTFRQKELPIFAALMGGIVGYGILSNAGEIGDVLKPSNWGNLAKSVGGIALSGAAVIGFASVAAEWAKTGSFSSAISNTVNDLGTLIDRIPKPTAEANPDQPKAREERIAADTPPKALPQTFGI